MQVRNSAGKGTTGSSHSAITHSILRGSRRRPCRAPQFHWTKLTRKSTLARFSINSARINYCSARSCTTATAGCRQSTVPTEAEQKVGTRACIHTLLQLPHVLHASCSQQIHTSLASWLQRLTYVPRELLVVHEFMTKLTSSSIKDSRAIESGTFERRP